MLESGGDGRWVGERVGGASGLSRPIGTAGIIHIEKKRVTTRFQRGEFRQHRIRNTPSKPPTCSPYRRFGDKFAFILGKSAASSQLIGTALPGFILSIVSTFCGCFLLHKFPKEFDRRRAAIRHLFGERVIQTSDYLTRFRLGYPMHTLAIGPRAYFLENLNK